MTVSVFVQVPDHAEFTAEVTTVERMPHGRPVRLWHQVMKPGESSSFYPYPGASIFIAGGHATSQCEVGSNLATVFAFALGQKVNLVGSNERGTVIGRAEYAESARSYLIRYRAGDGRLTESWWSEPAIATANPLAPPAVESPVAMMALDPAPDPVPAAPEASASSAA